MQFQVPQYIDVEDHVVGPLTLRQFFYLAAGFLVDFGSFFFLATWAWLPFAAITTGIALAFALVKYNGRPLIAVAAAALRHISRPKTYVRAAGNAADPVRPAGLIARLGLELTAGTKPVTGRERGASAFFGRSLPGAAGAETLRDVTGDATIAKRIDYR